MAVVESDAHGERAADAPLLKALSRELVRIHKAQLGRGPERVSTHWAGADVLVAKFEQPLTPAERTLRRLGEHRELRRLRSLYDDAAVGHLREVVERLTGRRVRAFMSGIDTVADVAVETFVLHPPGYDEPAGHARPQ